MKQYQSWGKYPKAEQDVVVMPDRHHDIPVFEQSTVLAYGKGRSYGDVCLNNNNRIIVTSMLNHFISLDVEKGILRCESGVTLKEVLELIVPRGFFIPITPGTQFVTIGGMIANDVHGKNHHRVGTIGRYVNAFELLRSDGARLICSQDSNHEYYKATIGGLGLTGLITWVEFKLKPINSAFIYQEVIRFKSLGEFFEISAESDKSWEYTVSWIDAFAKKKELGRGIFFRGNHMTDEDYQFHNRKSYLSVPVDAPSWAMNASLLRLFNKAYYWRNGNSAHKLLYNKFFYPLDSISQWNNLYGKNGFFQYQCVVPLENAEHTIKTILNLCLKNKAGSFLSVLKKFGNLKSPGLLSFPREGYTLALDFPNRGKRTFEFLDSLDDIIRDVDGAVYPAKDARMNEKAFKQFYPEWQQFSSCVDPGFCSDFWRRVTGDCP